LYTSSFFDIMPLWALYITSAGIVLLSIELGWRIGNYRHQHVEKDINQPISATVGATLGLLAFLLAFTFGMAANRYDTRKQIVIEEANAIGTTYLRVDFLPEQLRDHAWDLLYEYTGLRAGGASSIMSSQGISKSASIQDRLWIVADDAKNISDTVATGLFIQSLNEMIDLDAVRVAALRNRIPDSIWSMLFIVTIFSMLALGYEFGLTGTRNWVVTLLLMIVFTAVLVLIADLDRPQVGWVQVSQQPLLDLLNKIGTPTP